MAVAPPVMAGPYLAMMKMMLTMQSICICPASMFAKSRMVSEMGFTRAEKVSMTAIRGLSTPGTSGEKISL